MKLKHTIAALLPLLLLPAWWWLEPSPSRHDQVSIGDTTSEASKPANVVMSPAVLREAAVPLSPGETVWQLSGATVLSRGQTVELPEGTLSSGHVLEAVAVNSATRAQGKVQIELAAFRPAQDMPGQKAGWWYISGDWRFVGDATAAANLPKARNGHLRAELSFNPAETPGEMTVQLWTSRLGSGARPTRVAGSFVGNHKFEGQLRFGGPAPARSVSKPNA